MQLIYLTRRNLLTLLSKLDRVKNGDESVCALAKCDVTHPRYPCSNATMVIAVEDEDYYSEERPPGRVHPSDEPVELR